ncbi:dynamin family protein [Planococcus citreus]|uniref:Small GTP-binding protein n=1 Tax=Planococcus citreus TaxID=1373 RepID=A0A497YLJ3_9BACL|nr:dynamin family protein [Planococcus citreus]RLJ90630.1 small GTP-binding protein [Planococcus citreus]
MTYIDEKERIGKLAEAALTKLESTLPGSSQMKTLTDLIEDLDEDSYKIMVVGEFKHGKSTFVNALLGRDIMPRGVTPTTATINVIEYGKEEKASVHKRNQTIEEFDTLDILKSYTADDDFDSDEIRHIKLTVDSTLLKNKVVLIDTPGVNDLSEQRSEVTHQFLPRADVVLFMGSLTSPIKASEEKFIRERLIKNGIDRVIFAANFMDSIDEEELDELTEFVERRLETITGTRLNSLYPLSALEALEGKKENDAELLNYSGLPELEEEILRRIESGSRGKEKIKNFTERLVNICEVIEDEIKTASIVSSQTIEELELQFAAIQKWFGDLAAQETDLQNYLYDREAEINFMVSKSLSHFGERLNDDIETRIHTFQGAAIKNLVENQLPMVIKSQFTTWIDQYEDKIHQLLIKLEKEVSQGLTRSFNQSIQLQKNQRASFNHLSTIPIFDAKSGNAHVKAGVILGSVGSVALLLGAPFFLPIVGMAGLPYISEKIAEKQLAAVKPELIMTARQKVNEMVKDFDRQLSEYIKEATNDIRDRSLEEFNRLLYSYETILNDEMDKHHNETADIKKRESKLEELKNIVTSYRSGVEIYG